MADQTDAAPAPRPGVAVDWTELRRQLGRCRRYWLRDPLLAALNFALYRAFRTLPPELGSAVGGLLGVINGRWRYHTIRERSVRLYRTLVGVDEPEARQAVMQLFATVGRVMAEFSLLDRLWDAGRIAVDGPEHLRAARGAGRPVIVMGLHLNNWEVIGPSLIGLGLGGFKFIYQPPVSRFDHRMAVAARERYGAIMLRPGVKAARIAHRLLVAERGVLLIYADDERQGRIGAPLFGRAIPPRANLSTIVRLAWASGAAVIPAYAERLGGVRFRVTYCSPIELLPEGDDRAARLTENVHRLDRVLTPLVLAHLDEWYMLLESRSR